MNILFKIGVSVIAIVLAIIHVTVPSIKIDIITLILIVLAIIPWIIPYIRGFEIPGVVKITLPDTKSATDKLKKEPIIIKTKPAHLKIKSYTPEVTVKPTKEDPFLSLRKVYKEDPNLALVGFRIEIEKRIYTLAEKSGISTERTGLQRLVRELIKNEIISSSAASGLLELIALGNQAAHGASVNKDAAEWVLDIGPSILIQLDDEGT